MLGIFDRVIRTSTRRTTPEEAAFERQLRNRYGNAHGGYEDRLNQHQIELEQARTARTRFWI